MNKLVAAIVSFLIGLAILYLVGFIIATIIAVIAFLVKQYIAYRQSKIQFTKWEYDMEYTPIITILPDGQKVFQNVTSYCRYNRFEEMWEFKKVVDPVKRPLNEAKSASDNFYLSRR